MFGRKKKEAAAAGDAKEKPEAPVEKTKPDKKSADTPAKGAARRTVAKPNGNDVTQKSTQILYRLNYAVKQRPLEPSRSTELIPLNKEFEDMRKHLRSLLTAVKKYHTAMQHVAECRQEVRDGCNDGICFLLFASRP